MKLIVTILTICFASTLIGQEWTEVASLPASAKKHHPVTFSINGIGYSATGSNSFDVPTSSFHKYDPQSDNWTTMDDFPGPARGFSYGVADDEYGYLGFGFNDQAFVYFNDFWRFDPNTEEWEEMASCPCQARTHPAMVLVNDKIFVGLGGSNNGNRDDWWEYDIPSNSWSQKADFPGAERHHPFYFSIGDLAYVGFGHGNSIYKDFYSYNPDTEVWTELNDFPGESRVAGTQFEHDGYGYILSGDGSDHDYMLDGEFWKYTSESDSWEQLPSHQGLSRWAPGSFVIDGEAYLIQGQERFLNQFPSSAVTNDVWKFDLDLFNSPFSVEENKLSTVNIYPNPSNGSIEFTELLPQGSTINVLNSLGQIAFESITDSESTSLNLTHLPKGAYVLKVLLDSEILEKKLMIQ